MKKEMPYVYNYQQLILQIVEIENANDISRILNNIVSAFHNEKITQAQFNLLMFDLDCALKSLGILKSN